MIGQLIMKCLHARTAAHVLHLQTRSYAAHMALGGFYDALLPLVDALAEAYQGEYGPIADLHAPYVKPAADPVTLIEDLRDWIDAQRYKCCDKSETAMQNMIDEIVALCQGTIYKLRFLK